MGIYTAVIRLKEHVSNGGYFKVFLHWERWSRIVNTGVLPAFQPKGRQESLALLIIVVNTSLREGRHTGRSHA